MEKAYLDFFDFILQQLYKIYPDSDSISSLVHEYKKETGIKLKPIDAKRILERYKHEYFEYVENTVDFIVINKRGINIVSGFGTLSKYFEVQNEQNLIELAIENENKALKKKNLELQNENLILQSKQLKRYILYSIISFLAGALLFNIRDILKFLCLLD